MMPLFLKSSRRTSSGLSLLQRGGFTLMEMFIALAVLGTIAAGAYTGFNEVNAYSVSSRLYSEAQAAAHNQIDLILSRGPFNITSVPNRVPVELMTTAELDALDPQPLTSPPPTSNKYYPYYRDTTDSTRFPGKPLAKQAFIYTDPVTGRVVVTGTLRSVITDAGATQTFAGVTSPLNVRKATVTVSYSFRSKNYNVVMETLRTADQ
jgi:prepilin-type N-terminal cleavage/methylation domain-containing protein